MRSERRLSQASNRPGSRKPQVSPGVDQRILHRILRSTLVTNNQSSDGFETAERARGELREGVAIACSCQDYEVSIYGPTVTEASHGYVWPATRSCEAIR